MIGSHALAAHGRPRYSGDFDVFVEPSRTNARKVCAALRDFGMGQYADDEDWFATADNVLRMGIPPMCLDVLTGIDAVSFAEAWRGRAQARFNDQIVYIIGRKEFIKNKRESGKKPKRAKDLLDIELLEEGNEPPVRATARFLAEYDPAKTRLALRARTSGAKKPGHGRHK